MKKQVLFVDDESKILEGLRRMLRPLRHELEMSFVESGKEALALMEKKRFDVIVSDMRMPGMDGAELLNRVREQHPEVVRIVLSGHSEMEAVVKAIGTVHQYLSKPCDAETLKGAISRALSLRNVFSNEHLMQLITGRITLPSLPQLYLDLNEELKCTEVSMTRLSRIIAADMGMTAKILQLVNSSFFGLPSRIVDPSQAVRLLGIDTIKTLVLSVHIFDEFDQSSSNLPIKQVWQHSMEVAAFSKKIARTVVKDKQFEEHCFTSGVLHDCGKLILAASLPEKYNKALKIMELEKISLCEAEKRIFGTSHAEIGAYLLGLWGMPDLMLETVAFHHNPGDCPTPSFQQLTCVHLANCFSNELRQKEKGFDNTVNLDLNYLERLEVSDRLEEWRNICFESISEEAIV